MFFSANNGRGGSRVAGDGLSAAVVIHGVCLSSSIAPTATL